jgi:hypothetical protein
MILKLDTTTTDHAITMLMSRPNLPRNVKLDPEKQECIFFADRMRLHTSQGRYKGIWGHIPNEGKRGLIEQLVMRAMGLIPGSTDFYFMWKGGGCVIEFKVPERMAFRKDKYVKVKATTQSDNQKFFQKWCEYVKVPYFVVTRSDEAEMILRSLNALP